MKITIIIASASLILSITGYSQKLTPDKVPAPVKEAFAKQFPGAKPDGFEMEKNVYEINFKEKGVEKSANFDAAGTWIDTETAIRESDLPKEVISAAANFFPAYKISDVSRVNSADKVLSYEMDLTRGEYAYEVRFSPAGDILRKKSLNEEEEDDD
jgi:hypothetical protein